MKLIEALRAAKDAQPAYDASIKDLHYWLFGYYHHDFDSRTFEHHIKERYVKCWICTDTLVGLAALYYDEDLIGYSWQSARKDDKIYRFVSLGARIKLTNLIKSLKRDGLRPLDDVLTAADLAEDISHIINRQE